MGSKPDVYVMGWSARLQSFTAPTETMCVWLSLTHLRNTVQCWKTLSDGFGGWSHFFYLRLIVRWSRVELYLQQSIWNIECTYSIVMDDCFNVFQQSNAWWKLKTIVNCPLLTSQRRRLSWVQLAGHKGKPFPQKAAHFSPM